MCVWPRSRRSSAGDGELGLVVRLMAGVVLCLCAVVDLLSCGMRRVGCFLFLLDALGVFAVVVWGEVVVVGSGVHMGSVYGVESA